MLHPFFYHPILFIAIFITQRCTKDTIRNVKQKKYKELYIKKINTVMETEFTIC